MIADYLTLPSGWLLTHIINLDPGWQVNTKDDEYVVVATGDSIEAAMNNALQKITQHQYTGPIFRLASTKQLELAFDGKNLLSALGLTRPSAPIKRRL